MHIVVVSDAIYPYNKGGKEKRLYELTTRFAKHGHRVTILTMQWWKGPKTIKRDNITLVAVSPLYPLYTKTKRRSLTQALFFGIRVFFPLLRTKADIYEVDHIPYIPLFIARLASIFTHTPVVATWHEVWGRALWISYLGPIKGTVAYIAERLSVKMPHHISAVSQLTTNGLTHQLHVSPADISVAPNGIDMDAVTAVRPHDEHSDLIVVGRLLKNKNVDLVINALSRMHANGHRYSLTIIGDGPEKKHLEKLTKKNHLCDNVRFLGFLPRADDVYRYLKSSSLCIAPSSREGFGIIALEAFACEVPVITIDAPHNAIKNLVKDTYNGFIVSKDTQALAKCITDFFENKYNIAAMKKNAAATARSYNWNTVANDVLQIYSSQIT